MLCIYLDNVCLDTYVVVRGQLAEITSLVPPCWFVKLGGRHLYTLSHLT